jgi:hypothetical protein
MAIVLNHAGVIKQGKFFPDDPRLYLKVFNSFKDGERVELSIRKESIDSTDPLVAKCRGYYFGVVLQAISDETEHSFEVIHYDMKRRYSSYSDDHGILIIASVFSNESLLDLDEKWTFIKNVRRWASDFLDLQIPEPKKVHDSQSTKMRRLAQ